MGLTYKLGDKDKNFPDKPKKIKKGKKENDQAKSDYEMGQQRKKERLKSSSEYDNIKVKNAVERNIATNTAVKKGAKLNYENKDGKTTGGNPGFVGEQEAAPYKEKGKLKAKIKSIFTKRKPAPKFMAK